MKPENIILHHSLTKDGKTVSWPAIRKYHLNLGWIDIGYHAGIELVNEEHEILIGRMFHSVGAHCYQEGMNRKSLGICFIGNYDIDEVPTPMWDKGIDLVRFLMFQYHIPKERILGHREIAAYKSCPGKKFDLDLFRFKL